MRIRKLIEDLMIERMGENDEIVTRYMADREFQGSAFPILAREIFEAVRTKAAGAEPAFAMLLRRAGQRPLRPRREKLAGLLSRFYSFDEDQAFPGRKGTYRLEAPGCQRGVGIAGRHEERTG